MVNKAGTPSALDLCLFDHWDATTSSEPVFKLHLWSSAPGNPEKDRFTLGLERTPKGREDSRKQGKESRSRHGGPPEKHLGGGRRGQSQPHLLAQGNGNVHAFLVIFASLHIKVGPKREVLGICECNGPVLINRVALEMKIVSSPS